MGRKAIPARVLAAAALAGLAGAAQAAPAAPSPEEARAYTSAIERMAGWLFAVRRPTFAPAPPGLAIDFPAAFQKKEELESGEVVFRVRGTITNVAEGDLDVPDLRVVFRDRRERMVGDWTVPPPRRRLAPGERVTIAEAIAAIPPGAASAEIGWAPR